MLYWWKVLIYFILQNPLEKAGEDGSLWEEVFSGIFHADREGIEDSAGAEQNDWGGSEPAAGRPWDWSQCRPVFHFKKQQGKTSVCIQHLFFCQCLSVTFALLWQQEGMNKKEKEMQRFYSCVSLFWNITYFMQELLIKERIFIFGHSYHAVLNLTPPLVLYKIYSSLEGVPKKLH